MPLPRPQSDEHSYATLVAEGQARLPLLAPAWTDHNAHDPGITLLELLAWLAEGDLYRLGRMPAAPRTALLALLGAAPRPAQAAETVVGLGLSAGGALDLPAGLQIGGGGLVFQTQEPLRVSPARLVALLAGDPAALELLPLGTLAAGQPSAALGRAPGPGHALYLGFDQALDPGPISLYLWTGDNAADLTTRARLIDEQAAALRDTALCGVSSSDLPDWRLHYAARTVWEYYCDGWVPLADVQDETRGLTVSGPVRFTIPATGAHVPHGVGGPQYAAMYFVRCRLASGAYDCPPLLHHIAVNAVLVRHAADAPQATLGRSDGRAAQSFELPLKPALPGSLRLHVELDGAADSAWHERDDLERAGSHERACVLDREAGVVRFGDGRHGRVPPAGASLRADYRIGGGAAGNLAAGSLGEALAGAHNEALVPGWSTTRPRLTLYQPAPAHSGADSETFEDARRRLLERLAAPQRAVTLSDYTALALAAPGLPLARAYALADYHPAYPCLPAPGCVTVVVLPRCPDRLPTPSPALLRALRRYLERRRTLGDELQLVGPRYSVVGVRARLVAPGGDRVRLARAALTALDTFLHPLRGGSDGAGWPVGRPVYRSEILALLGRLPGVAYVADLELLAQDEPAEGEHADERPAQGSGCGSGCNCGGDCGCGGCDHGGNGGARCGNLAICPDGLPAPGRHTILVETRPEQTAEGAPR